jgi:hypothetical protein
MSIDNKSEITLLDVITGFHCVLGAINEDVLALIELVDEETYSELRGSINDAFQVGAISDYDGVVEDETELGDVSDCLILSLKEKYPPEIVNGRADKVSIAYDARVLWRNELIVELDQMVQM